MRVVVLRNAVADEARQDERDVLVQSAAVAGALRELGHEPIELDCTLDLESLGRRLERLAPGAVFNLVESLGGSDRLAHLVPDLLEALGVPFTGCPGSALRALAGKVTTKKILRGAGLPTPDWLADRPDDGPAVSPGRYIIKTVYEHASLGLGDDSIVCVDGCGELRQALAAEAARHGRPCLAERFIEGREFNLSLLDGPAGPQVLPPAEIDFSAFPPGKPRIVGYAAKWHEGSYEFAHTPRRFDFPPADEPLVARLRQLALAAWRLFGLAGYARVDFRVDESGHPWILELNANPCLSPDAGFRAALSRASVSFPAAVSRILLSPAR
jgi:D-alanine-D-alanine ligase